jgi:Reverse transcriptase (RNA-dependent DNA polymerase)
MQFQHSHPILNGQVGSFDFLNKEETSTTCAELTRAMYGNIDAPLQWMKTFSALLKGTKMNMQQSHSDPCIFYKHKEGKLVLILVVYVDDTLCAGEKEEVN